MFRRPLTRSTARTTRQVRSFRPQVQRLEEVIAPANAVAVTNFGGTLTITSQELNPGEAKQNVTITGDLAAPGAFTITAAGGTTISGSASASGVRNIVVNLKAGSDTLALDKIRVAGNITLNMGDTDLSPDSIFITNNLVAGGNVSVTQGKGGSIFNAATTNLTVGGSLLLNNGSGVAITDLGATATIGGGVTVSNGLGGGDSFSMGVARLGGNLTINNGDGDGVTASNTTFTGDLTARAVTIRGGLGADTVNLGVAANLNIASLTLNLGNDANTVRLDNGLNINVFGNISYTGGAGDDSLFIGKAGQFVSARNVNINANAGFANVVLKGTHNVFGNLSFTAGAGGGSHNLDASGSLNVTGAMTTSFGEAFGDNLIFLEGATTVGSLSVTNGIAGSGSQLAVTGTFASAAAVIYKGSTSNDHVSFNDSLTVRGGLSLDMKAGQNQVDFSGNTSLDGAITFTGLEGDDRLLFHGNLATRGVTFNAGDAGIGNFLVFDGNNLIEGAVLFNGGKAVDTFSVGLGKKFDVSSNVTFNAGLGTDVFLPNVIATSTIGGSLTLNLGDGDEAVALDHLFLGGALKIDLGAGNDSLVLGSTGMTVRSAISIQGRAGTDTVIAGNNLQALSTFLFEGGDDVDTLNFDVGSLFVGGATFNGGGAVDVLSGQVLAFFLSSFSAVNV